MPFPLIAKHIRFPFVRVFPLPPLLFMFPLVPMCGKKYGHSPCPAPGRRLSGIRTQALPHTLIPGGSGGATAQKKGCAGRASRKAPDLDRKKCSVAETPAMLCGAGELDYLLHHGEHLPEFLRRLREH